MSSWRITGAVTDLKVVKRKAKKNSFQEKMNSRMLMLTIPEADRGSVTFMKI